LKLLEKSKGKTLEDIDIGKAFLNKSSIAQKLKIEMKSGFASN
jgi:hypothetical protein